jgi:hypothetical protein
MKGGAIMIGTNEYHGDEGAMQAEKSKHDDNNPNDEPCFDDAITK